ncbi:hypothetical protein MS3_00003255 [Schistosoma haematobium]|uniref:Uncharacterized protein n=1 Tax=Schistosoma haematobium TaxID=6185 RepID=A0A922S2F2_SCHHA|nr:hypothetical protein MS3_00003255 [Schistosoma haematobium]KAH9590660.1 hypothetical protein MS3_00003255 [Schistosoma haematobium]CAH8660235.1 unnamed protein product [Schistosoma haematobium]CAH8666225.1 unnamed protein product [Schistosoma haematobium]
MTTGPEISKGLEQWNTDSGKNAILQYGFELISNTVKAELVPQLLLDSIKEIYQDINSNLSNLDAIAFKEESKNGTTQRITPKVIMSELSKVIQPEEFSQTSDLHQPIVQKFGEKLNNRGKIWCAISADRAVKNALAFDILESILLGLIKFTVPRIIRFTMGEEFVFIIIFEQTISDTIKELTTNEYNLQHKILRMNRLKMIDKVARKKPGDVLVSMAIDSLLSLSMPGPITGTYTNNSIEEKLLKTLVCDVLLNRICSVDGATNRVGECLPLATYHDMISEDIFFTEGLEMLKYHIDNDLEDIDLIETHQETKPVFNAYG